MGCVFGREATTAEPKQANSSKASGVVAGESSVQVTTKSNGSVVDVEKKNEEENGDKERKSKGDRRRSKPNPRLSNPSKHWRGEQVAAGWPSWLSDACGEALNGWVPRKADTFEKIDKIGQGTYSNVYKAKDMLTGKIVALKKVRFDNLEPESVKFMAREILVLRRLDHPNVVKLEGLVTSRMSCSLYLVFQYMDHDLAGLASSPVVKFSEPEVKCLMRQLISGLEHCHSRGVLHRDIKGSNLLIDDGGVLKIADFGLATIFDPNHKRPMTSRVVTLWYRAPELLLGATDYGVGIDLWSAGCILAELLAGRPIMPGRTEVEQLHKIYKLCGSPSEDYWKKGKFTHGAIYKPREPYKRSIRETFKDFPPSSLPLIDALLSIEPEDRQTASAALKSEFFTSEPYACEPADLPKYPPSKEMDAKRRDEETRRQRAASKAQGDGARKNRHRDRSNRALPAPEANAELQSNVDQRRRLITHANAKSKSEKFPPPHQDGGAMGVPLGASQHIDPTFIPRDMVPSFTSSSFNFSKDEPPTQVQTWSGPLGHPITGISRKKKDNTKSSKGKRAVMA
ncbi:probable serine/threonine-protein kinase At1g54610 isoform X1 [Arabidopsis lyrata subsp. lyrata]|uniref:probable serine/threonine-protein kinase At1g54610 isoform X1 n=1 Tax=Arabidopsis lyrata subsp. lyrata TaxID=81972 RepID=UPI000A29AC10|nr:probable serine/threonine-protein kinase At1g54610 isoform X1 [Arabidopsis lyrata subsp. lyrata]XP_020867359.1 probable serine/threonine-protein kinase At1g54610 isoform X1 [Arabidopsis lyrata subsp. lyrata]|eukprot:XP_020867358.1 probable serine/threonine-protein kinase At1g54610 isoform X1 [Arabidopsis lyrata subsp. lyrata]